MNRHENKGHSKTSDLQPLRCPQCHKLLLTEEVQEGTLEIICKRCHRRVRLEATKQHKIIKMKG